MKNNTSFKKNLIIYKLCKIIIEIERHLVYFSKKVKSDIHGKLSLRNFGESGFTLQEDLKIIPKKKEPKNELKEEIKALNSKNHYLECEILTVKELYENLVDKWREGNDRIRHLEEENERMRIEHEQKLNSLIQNSAEEVLRIRNKIVRDQTHFGNFRKDLLNELKIKDLLIERNKGYGEVLKKELVTAKNILKDPATLKKANRDMNFESFEIYPIKTIEQEVNTTRHNEK